MNDVIHTLSAPVTVGDFGHPISIDKLELFSISLTMASVTPTLSIVLFHRASGYQINIIYQDATVSPFWVGVNAANTLEKAIFQKLTSDGKLPTGTLA